MLVTAPKPDVLKKRKRKTQKGVYHRIRAVATPSQGAPVRIIPTQERHRDPMARSVLTVEQANEGSKVDIYFFGEKHRATVTKEPLFRTRG